MVNRLRALNVVDFTGGLNLRPETFQLLENELPELLNMEPDPRGGIVTRGGWDRWHAAEITEGAWDPRNAYMHIQADGDRLVLVANRLTGTTGEVRFRIGNDNWVTTPSSLSAPPSPHLADFASWGDKVFVTRGNQSVFTFDGTAVGLGDSGAGAWADDYSTPGATDRAPRANLVAEHMGYLFVAATYEDGTHFSNRLRWSHPANPLRWASFDFIDVNDGGSKITAIIPFADRLLIFKPDSVWALYGYNADTWEVVNVSRTVGTHSPQTVCRSEAACYFVSWPLGVFAITDRGIADMSTPIRRVFQTTLTQTAMDNTWLGFMGRRLWLSIPWLEGDTPTQPTTAFVFDPEVGNGAWTAFRGADGTAPAAYIENTQGDLTSPLLAFSRTAKRAIALDANDDALDDFDGAPSGFTTRLRTRWLDAGAPTHKKSWRRPDFLIRGATAEMAVNVAVYHDFDFVNAERQFEVIYSPFDADTGLWGEFDWGDGTLYGGGQTSAVERGSTMGRAGAVQLAAVGPDGVPWGFNGIICKYIPRRFR